MKENLNIGIRIEETVSPTNNGIIQKYCYSNYESSCDVYGGLYEWNEMMQYSISPGVKGICPDNWHIPTNAEWTTLINFLGGESTAGGKMKTTSTIEEGTGLWYWPNAGATNSSGFSALPGGSYYYNQFNKFFNRGNKSEFWSSSTTTNNHHPIRSLSHDNAYVGESSGNGIFSGNSVRCVKDN